MGRGERYYRGATAAFATVICAFGIVILVRAIAEGAGPTSVGILLGVLFTVLGAARLWIAVGGRR